MSKGRFYDEMDIQAVESKLNDVTVTAIPMSSVASKQQYGHHHSNSNSSHYQSSKSSKNQNNQYLTYQQNQLIQSAIQLVQQQQLQQQQQHQQQQQQQQQQQRQRQQERERERELLESANLNRLVSATPPASQLYSGYSQNTNGLGLTQASNASTQQGSGLSKYAQLLAVIEEMGRDIRPTYAMGRGDRLKRLIIQAKVLVRECLMETERSARQ